MPSVGGIGAGPILQLNPSSRCNIACGHCSASSGPQASQELPRELLHAALKDAAHLGYERLAISGGEPFLYDGLPGLLARARRLDFVTTVTTNGMLINQARRWAPVAPLIDFLAVSILGTEAEHDALCRREGAYAQTVANLEVVRTSRVPFGFVFTLTQHNAGSLEHVVRLAASEGARSVQVHGLTLAGRAAETMPNDRPDTVEFGVTIAEARRLGTELGVAVTVDAVTQDQLVLYRGRFVPQFPSRDLSAMAPVLIIESDGRVIPMTHELPGRLALGSLHRHRLASLAPAWLRSGRAAELASACDRTWWELATPGTARAAHWYDEVATRVNEDEVHLPLLAAA